MALDEFNFNNLDSENNFLFFIFHLNVGKCFLISKITSLTVLSCEFLGPKLNASPFKSSFGSVFLLKLNNHILPPKHVARVLWNWASNHYFFI